ncbi:MAG: hypothetical protein GY703_21885 [Gammaproteobacteria bacterium]|nr:hypothetical protein [Gammaproteobacteria bacterium]
MNSDVQLAGNKLEAQADRFFVSGFFSEASAIYREVLEREPGRLDLQSRTGHLALLRNDPVSAIKHLANGETGSAALCYEQAGRNGLAGTLAVLADRELCRIEGTCDSLESEWLSDTPLPLIQGVINGVSVNLLVDTAADDLILDEKA